MDRKKENTINPNHTSLSIIIFKFQTALQWKRKKQFHALQSKLMWNSIVFSTWTLSGEHTQNDIVTWSVIEFSLSSAHCRSFAFARRQNFIWIHSVANMETKDTNSTRHNFSIHITEHAHTLSQRRAQSCQKLLCHHRQYTTIIIISRLVFSFPRKFPPKFSNWIHSHFKQCVSELSLSEAKRSTLHSTPIAAAADEEALSN